MVDISLWHIIGTHIVTIIGGAFALYRIVLNNKAQHQRNAEEIEDLKEDIKELKDTKSKVWDRINEMNREIGEVKQTVTDTNDMVKRIYDQTNGKRKGWFR